MPRRDALDCAGVDEVARPARRWSSRWQTLERRRRVAHRLSCGPTPAVVLYTSGSTGRPHGVVQTYRNIDANTRSIVDYLALSADDRALLALPLSYCYGRSVLQTHLFVGRLRVP